MRIFLVSLITLIAELRRLDRRKIDDTQLAMLIAKITPDCEGFLADCGCESLRGWVDSLVAGDKATWARLLIALPLPSEAESDHGLIQQLHRLMPVERVPRNSPEPTRGAFGPFAPKATGPADPPIPGAGYW